MPPGDMTDTSALSEIPKESPKLDGLSLLAAEKSMLSNKKELLDSEVAGARTGISNLVSVYAEVLPGIPASIASQLKTDLSDNAGSTAVKALESAAIGLGATVMLARSPVLAKTILAAGGIGAGIYLGSETVGFSYRAFNSASPEERIRLIMQARSATGRLGADLLETGPSFALGAGAAKVLLPRVAIFETVASRVQDSAEFRMRRVVPEGFHYLSPDARLAGRGQSGSFDILKAGQEMIERTPWRGVEEGRFLKTNSDALKMSARLPGARDEVMMGRRSEHLFHTHEKSVLPSSGDFNSVYGTGVVGVPKDGLLVFYEGSGRQAETVTKLMRAGKLEEAGAAAENLHNQTFRAMALDPARELAARVDMRWNPLANRLEPSSVLGLDYAATVKNLSKWSGALNIESMPVSQQSLLKPGMTDFLRQVLKAN